MSARRPILIAVASALVGAGALNLYQHVTAAAVPMSKQDEIDQLDADQSERAAAWWSSHPGQTQAEGFDHLYVMAKAMEHWRECVVGRTNNGQALQRAEQRCDATEGHPTP